MRPVHSSGGPLRACLVFAAAACFTASPAVAEQSAARIWNEELLAAIRRNVPNPPAHARTLFHSAAAMYSAWAAFDPIAVGYLHHEKLSLPPDARPAARREAVSYSAYLIIRDRFQTGPGATETLPHLDAVLASLGYSPATALAPPTASATPAELGKRCAASVLAWARNDGFSLTDFPEPYRSTTNPNVLVPMPVLGMNGAFQPDMPLGLGIPQATHPNFWQPLEFSTGITQNGIPQPGGVQPFVGVQGLAITPFSLTRSSPSKPWTDPFGGPSKLSLPGLPSPSDAKYRAGVMDVLRFSAALNDPTLIDISPASLGNCPIGSDESRGYPRNPATGQPYRQHLVPRGDFGRVLAEYWADGPDSETPPGHWHVIANEISDRPDLPRLIGGTTPVADALEWDTKLYFALAASLHDAACAAWSLKRYYSGPRPITMIRYLASHGQSSDPALPSYHPLGLPLEPGVAEVVTEASAAPGGRHETIWELTYGMPAPGSLFTGRVVVRSWPGEHPENPPFPAAATHASPVQWMLATDWLPFQRKAFNTPAFPGYVSGHSCFSHAAAAALASFTGSPWFPSGLHTHTVPARSLRMDLGPSTDIPLQWARYTDAADQAGISRRWGGIHIPEDDHHGRLIGSSTGSSSFTLAQQYWTGAITSTIPTATASLSPAGPSITWNALRGAWYAIESSTDLTSWSPMASPIRAYDTTTSWTDPAPRSSQRFYRVIQRFTP